MSLFDVIKYPIQIPYVEDQLMALPADIYEKWYVTRPDRDTPFSDRNLLFLRRMILEWERHNELT